MLRILKELKGSKEDTMKIKLLFFSIIINCAIFGQTKVGQISFLLGTVEYSIETKAEWKPLDVGMNIFSNWVIRGADDAELEITWDNGVISEVSDLNSVKVTDLMKKANLETDNRSCQLEFSKMYLGVDSKISCKTTCHNRNSN